MAKVRRFWTSRRMSGGNGDEAGVEAGVWAELIGGFLRQGKGRRTTVDGRLPAMRRTAATIARRMFEPWAARGQGAFMPKDRKFFVLPYRNHLVP